jgi:hypothetical protein
MGVGATVVALSYPLLRRGDGSAPAWRPALLMAVLVGLGSAAGAAGMFMVHPTVPFAGQVASLVPVDPAREQKDWTAYGNTPGGSRFVALDQITRVRIGALRWVREGLCLPHPQMAPALLELIACTTVAGYGSGADQFSQPLLSVFPLQAAASAVTQAGTSARAGEAFAQLPAFTGGLKADLHLRFSHKRIRLHALEQFTAGFHWEE